MTRNRQRCLAKRVNKSAVNTSGDVVAIWIGIATATNSGRRNHLVAIAVDDVEMRLPSIAGIIDVNINTCAV